MELRYHVHVEINLTINRMCELAGNDPCTSVLYF